MPTFQNGALTHVRRNMKNTKHLAKSLLNTEVPRVRFNPKNPEHLASLKSFRDTGKMTVRFYNPSPLGDLLTTLEKQFIREWLPRAIDQLEQERPRVKEYFKVAA